MTHHLADRGAPFRFVLPGLALADSKAGYIINRVNDSLLIEGIGSDHGLYFVKKGNTITQFDTKLAADSAMDALTPFEKQKLLALQTKKSLTDKEAEELSLLFNKSKSGQDQGILTHSVEPRGKDPHENPYVDYDKPDTRSGKDSKEGTMQEAWVGGKKQKVWIPSKETAEKAAG